MNPDAADNSESDDRSDISSLDTIIERAILVSDESVREYAELYKQDFSEEITFEEAKRIAINLLIVYGIIARPLSGEADDLSGTS